jgi:hypothetical protein
MSLRRMVLTVWDMGQTGDVPKAFKSRRLDYATFSHSKVGPLVLGRKIRDNLNDQNTRNR